MKWSGAWGVWGGGSERGGLYLVLSGFGNFGEDVRD